MIDPETVRTLVPLGVTAVIVSIGGWVVTTWLRVRHGYPLDGAWGQAVHPAATNEDKERIKLIGSENAQLRAELAGVKDRLAVLERLATDSGARLSDSIEQLRNPRIN